MTVDRGVETAAASSGTGVQGVPRGTKGPLDRTNKETIQMGFGISEFFDNVVAFPAKRVLYPALFVYGPTSLAR